MLIDYSDLTPPIPELLDDFYVKVTEGVAKKYTLAKLRRDNPQVSFPSDIPDSILAEYGVYIAEGTSKPDYDPIRQNVKEGTPELVNGQWRQVWDVTDATPEEVEQRINQLRVEATLTPAQFRLGLLSMGELDAVEAAIPSASREVQIMWQYSSSFERLNSDLLLLASQMGYTDEQMDALFGIEV